MRSTRRMAVRAHVFLLSATLLLSGSLLSAAAISASAADNASEPPSAKRYIVVLKDSVDDPGQIARAQAEQHRGELGLVYRSALKGYSATLPPAAAEAIARDPRVDYVAPDRKVEVASQTTPTGIQRIGATANASLDIDGVDDVRVNVDVAVVDTGIDPAHPDLNVVGKMDCVPADGNAETKKCSETPGGDPHGHGTHVAGTVGAIDNGVGVVGAAPGARLWSVRVLNQEGSGYDAWVLAGIDWVTANAATIEVVNMSLGAVGSSQPTSEAIAKSVDAGVVYAVAAGNSSRNAERMYPASSPDVITVSALADYDGEGGGKAGYTCLDNGADDTLASFSNWGQAVEVAAPGVCVYSTLSGGGYGFKSGTSMASPHVAGAAAVLAAKANPGSRADVESIRGQLIDGGSLAWTDSSNDAKAEPVLHLDDAPIATAEVVTAGVSSTGANPAGATATINGATNLRGATMAVRFEYGTSRDYGQTSSTATVSDSSPKYRRFNAVMSNLKAGQRYHYRLILVPASGGPIYGQNRTFVASRWHEKTPLSSGKAHELLNGVSCTSSTSCLAVGDFDNGDDELAGYRLSGSNWSSVSVPVPSGGLDPALNAVSCTASNQCTAVGNVTIPGSIRPLVERWNGTSWTVQSTAQPESTYQAYLRGVSCPTSSNCIAVGTMSATPVWRQVNYVSRWQGGGWSTMQVPNPTPVNNAESVLDGVSCVSANWCFAVGWYWRENIGFAPTSMVWNGSTWTERTPARTGSTVRAVSCVDSSFCVAVGWPSAEVEVWDGSQWTAQAVPGSGAGVLYDVSCPSKTDCTATGYASGPAGGRKPLVLTWDGVSWKSQAAPPSTEAAATWTGVSCLAQAGCKAVGKGEVAEERAVIASREPFVPDPAARSDLDADGRPDLVSVSATGEVRLNRGTAAGISATGTSIGQIDTALYDSTGQYVVDSADVDGDRQADLVTVSDAGAILVRPGEGEEALGAPVTSQAVMPLALNRTGSFEPIGVADLNNDRKGDLVAYNVSPSGQTRVSVYLGRSDWRFSPTPIHSLETWLQSALWSGEGDYFLGLADIDGNGAVDLVTNATYGAVHVHAGKGDGSFRQAGINAAAVDPIMDNGTGQEPIGLGDVTGDGKADLLTLSGSTLKLYAGQAENFFSISLTEPVGNAYPSAIDSSLLDGAGEDLIGLLDYSGDGRPDLVSATSDGSVKSYPAQASPSGAFGAPTVVSAGLPSGRHHVNPGYQFSVESPIVRRQGCTTGVGCRWIAQGLDSDVDGDRRADLTTLHSSGSAYVFAGDASAGISTSNVATSLSGIDPAVHDDVGRYVVDSGDVTGDGRSDLVTIAATGGVSVHPGQADRKFGGAVESLPLIKPVMAGGGNFEPIAVADANGDGHADLIGWYSAFGIVGHTAVWGHPNGTFGPASNLSQAAPTDSALFDGVGNYYVDASDVTGEGNADLVAVGNDGSLRVFRGVHSRTEHLAAFQKAVNSSFSIDPIMGDGQGHEPVGLGDVDGDGRADLVVQHRASHQVFVLRGRTDGAFEEPAGGPGAWVPARTGVNSSLADRLGQDLVGLLDTNGDARSDLVSVTTDEEVRVYRGQQDGSFAAPTIGGPVRSNRFAAAPGHQMATEKPFWRREPSVVPTSPPAPWTSGSIAPASFAAEDVACPSSSSCVAVGAHEGHAKALSWNGSSWSAQTTPVPAGASSSGLSGVSCISPTACTAAGSFVESGVAKTLVMSWNGTAWSIAASPNPSGATESRLAGVSCSGSTACLAVGSQVDAGGTRRLLALRFSSGSWSVSTTNPPSGATSSEYTDVSCAVAANGACAAVGSYVDGASGARRTLARDFAFAQWSAPAQAEPEGATSAELLDVGCMSASTCAAVGSYVSASGVRKALVTSRSLSTWTVVNGPSPFAATTTYLESVSCGSAATCTAVGRTTVGGAEQAFALSLEGEWEGRQPAVPAGATASRLAAVACPSESSCLAVGRSTVGGAPQAFAAQGR